MIRQSRWFHPSRRVFSALLLLLALGLVSFLAFTNAPSRVLAAGQLSTQQAAQEQAQPSSPPAMSDPDLVCAKCHGAIYAKYEATSMARGSGPATAALDEGTFTHKPSDITYRVFSRDGAAWMSFSRPAMGSTPGLEGERQLQYFIGSGQKGRTYLYRQGSEWFELPINFYTRRGSWGMAPAFDAVTSMPADLPTDPNCLHCHASLVQSAEPSARNRFPSAPFLQGGVGCNACHGDPAAHLRANGHGPIVNPRKLGVAQRDSACLQCHLEGDAVVYRPGTSLAQFRIGEDLADSAVYFVRSDRQSGGGRASSQYEALLRSACRRATGDSLTCTSCHDPHFTPAPAQRVAYFRARCLACHNTPTLVSTHHPEQPDCATCHMPTRGTTDISHEQSVDHDIEAHPAPASAHPPAPLRKATELIPLLSTRSVGDREYGLAYAQLAAHGDQAAASRALALLTRAAAAGSSDPEFESRFGYLQQIAGEPEKARSAYEAALGSNPFEPTALANLAVLDASNGRLPEAVHLLDRLVTADPSQTSSGLNLAFIVCSLGHGPAARRLAEHLQTFNPDDPQLRVFLNTGTYAGQHCESLKN